MNTVNKKLFPEKVLLDTNFIISLLNSNEVHHENAKNYFEEMLDDGVDIYISSVVLSELFKDCGNVFNLFKCCKLLNFSDVDAKKVWDIFDISVCNVSTVGKNCVKDDFKIAAQAINRGCHVATADSDFVSMSSRINLSVLDIKIPVSDYLGRLDI